VAFSISKRLFEVEEKKINVIVFFLLAGYLCLGISHIAMLPPWEGFDETAHYSYLQQIADTGKLPRQKKARISQDVENYTLFAPVPYSSNPPMQNNGGYTYKAFFKLSSEIMNIGYDYVKSKPDKPRFFTEGRSINWQSQQPPLYYLLLSPIYFMTRHLSWGEEIFILRLISYLFAWSAILIGIYSFQQKSVNNPSLCWAIIGITLWPILFPSWFPAMARLGNDSLCALIMALIWFFLVKSSVEKISIKYSIIIGLLLGLGCITKAFFVPVSVGILSFYCFRFWMYEKIEFHKIIYYLSVAIICIIGVSGWWYFANWYQYGVLIGSDEMIALYDAGGFSKFIINNFQINKWIRGCLAFITTLSWCSSWSWARPPYMYLAPMVLIVFVVFISYAISLRGLNKKSVFWLPLWCLLPVLLGFSFHVLIRIALTSEGRGTSGYYLNFMIVPLGTALGSGFYRMWKNRTFKIMVIILSLYAIILSITTIWAQVLLFSGIIYKADTSKFYQLPEIMPPSLGLSETFTKLKIISFPYIGISMLIIGSIMLIIGLPLLWRFSNQLKRAT